MVTLRSKMLSISLIFTSRLLVTVALPATSSDASLNHLDEKAGRWEALINTGLVPTLYLAAFLLAIMILHSPRPSRVTAKFHIYSYVVPAGALHHAVTLADPEIDHDSTLYQGTSTLWQVGLLLALIQSYRTREQRKGLLACHVVLLLTTGFPCIILTSCETLLPPASLFFPWAAIGCEVMAMCLTLIPYPDRLEYVTSPEPWRRGWVAEAATSATPAPSVAERQKAFSQPLTLRGLTRDYALSSPFREQRTLPLDSLIPTRPVDTGIASSSNPQTAQIDPQESRLLPDIVLTRVEYQIKSKLSKSPWGISILRWWRPELSQNKRRIEWTCSCGILLYSDYDVPTPASTRALDDLQRNLQTVAAISSNERPSAPPHEIIRNERGDSTNLASGSRESGSARQHSGASPITSTSGLKRRNDSSSRSNIQTFFELCVNTSSKLTALEEIRIKTAGGTDHIYNDFTLFSKFLQLCTP